jgi:hypothetical protein
MSISYVAAGTQTTGTTSVTVPHPAGIAAGDLEVMQVVSGHPTNLQPSVPAGWQKVGEFNGGDPAAYGTNAGPRRVTLMTRIADGVDAQPTIAMPSGTNVFLTARIYAIHSSTGAGWRYATSFGEDTSSGTTVSVTGGDAMTWAANDFVFQFFGVPLSTATMSAEGISAAGVTFGTTTERQDAQASAGANVRVVASTASVTSVTGAPNTAPTITGTLSGANFAVGGVLRARESTATITATVQSAFPPRVLVTVEGMLAEDIASVTIYRSALDTLTPLRAATDVDVTGSDALVRNDGEQPMGVPVSYVAVLKDVEGNDWTIVSNTVQTDIDHEVLSDAVLGVGVDVQIVNWRDKKYERETTVFNVSGRLVVVSGPNPGATSDLVLFTRTTADRDAMLYLLDNATNGIVQIRTMATEICETDEGFDQHAQIDNYVAVLATVLERAGRFRYPERDWTLSVAEVDPWLNSLEARGWTYADVENAYTDQTYAAIDTDFALLTYLDIDTRDWGV